MITEKSAMEIFKGSFIASPETIQQKLKNIKAFIFDWDGVFNNGHKFSDGNSSFSETDSMGTNLLRFNQYLMSGQLPPVAVITGEHNNASFYFAKRECLHNVYYKIKDKQVALHHFCEQHHLLPSEVLFVFDDVLDFSAAKLAGLRMMVNHSCNPLLTDYVIKNNLADYLTYHEGGSGAVREVSELIMFLSGNFEQVMEHRVHYDETYKKYIGLRNQPITTFFTSQEYKIIQQEP